MTDRRRLPSTPGIPGARLPPPASVPPEERLLRELAQLEGRVLARLADLDTRLEQLEGGHAVRGQDVHAMRDDVAQLRADLGRLTAAVLEAQQHDVRLTKDVGEIRAELVAAGAGAGARAGAGRGALAGIGTVLTALGARWLAQRLGIPLP